MECNLADYSGLRHGHRVRVYPVRLNASDRSDREGDGGVALTKLETR